MRSMSRIGAVMTVFVLMLAGSGVASAQTPAAPALTAKDVTTFVGDWVVTSKGEYGESTFAVAVKTADDKVTMEISSDQMPMMVVSDLAKQKESLVAYYSITYEGNPVPVVLTLTPAGEGLDAAFDYASGAYVAYGKGTKKPAGD
jgi:hypothetical protein